jgi:hypothetical protein
MQRSRHLLAAVPGCHHGEPRRLASSLPAVQLLAKQGLSEVRDPGPRVRRRSSCLRTAATAFWPGAVQRTGVARLLRNLLQRQHEQVRAGMLERHLCV